MAVRLKTRPLEADAEPILTTWGAPAGVVASVTIFAHSLAAEMLSIANSWRYPVLATLAGIADNVHRVDGNG